MRKDDDKLIKVLAALIIVGILAASIAARWAVLTYAPCGMFTVAEAPVRCLK